MHCIRVESLLQAEGVAGLILYAANLPAHVKLAKSLILPTVKVAPSRV